MPDIGIELIELSEEALARMADSGEEWARERQIRVGPHGTLLHEVAAGTLAFIRANGIPARWGGYLAVDRSTRALLGTCGFKGAPDEAGRVEIAYFSFPGEEGRGVGTAMARGLIELALRAPEVRTVVAHTLPRQSASTTILKRLGFEHKGEVTDPEDGLVWRWEFTAGDRRRVQR
ncbi:MAG TPA: GNAT family N-acetyltransferase [Gemmatimonadales bacterium]|nr:GNAT family N-acetyltransferase [Gemmatimonadales bacterium]